MAKEINKIENGRVEGICEDIKMEDEQKNINFNESEIVNLKRALNCLIENEQDLYDYTDLLNKLDTYYD